MKRIISIITVILILLSTLCVNCPVVHAASETDGSNALKQEESLYSEEGAVLVDTIELESGIVCKIYTIASHNLRGTGTIQETHDFSLSYGENYFGYLRQITSWSYDGTNRPTFLSGSNTFYSIDGSKHYLNSVSTYTAQYGTSSRSYNKEANVYYNNTYIATTTFTTICDKNGNTSFACTDN